MTKLDDAIRMMNEQAQRDMQVLANVPYIVLDNHINNVTAG